MSVSHQASSSPARLEDRPTRQLRAMTTMITFSFIGNGAMVVQPMVVGALVDKLGFSERDAGVIASAELTGFSVGMLLLFAVAHRFPRVLLGAAGLALVTAANAVACLIFQFEPMLAARFVAGLGAAMAYSVFLTMAAGQKRPENAFAVVNATSIAYSGVFVFIAPMLLAAWGLPGILLSLGAMAVAAAATLPWLAAVEARGADEPHPRPNERPRMGRLSGSIILVLLMMGFLYTGHSAIWAYQERIGVGLGLSVQEAGKWIGISMLVWGVIGSLLARALGTVIGRVWPQMISLGVSILAALLLVFGTESWTFALACGLIALSWFYGLPYQMGLLAEFDRHGRANLLGCVMTTGGSALGPGIAAFLLGYYGHWLIGVLAGLCYLIALLLVLPPARQSMRTNPTP
jgi:predicted MFS family arabinose efflux permease